MRKNYFLLMLLVIFTGRVIGQTQPCGTDEVRKQLLVNHPEILQYEAELKRQINESLKHIDLGKAHKTTDTTMPDSFWYDIPVVVHIVHDFGSEYLSDDSIFNCLKQWNIVYAKQNADTADVIAPFKKWIGNPHIRLHLATMDPLGQPTKGITRHRSYLTYNATDQSKLDDWPNTSYLNIWFMNSLAGQNGFQPAAYAYFPATGAAIPYYDGVICFSSYAVVDKTINHEVGHYFSLYHVWGNNNSASMGTCADGGTDEVDDTPPTLGHLDCTKLYDTVCATNYLVIYTNAAGFDSLVDYPDTTNVQNIMDYSYCSKMFTKGQVARMHAALGSTVGSRMNLWSPFNLSITGALAPRPDLKPIPDFSAVPAIGAITPKYFTSCLNSHYTKGHMVKFFNESYNDTISTVRWQFTNGATTPDTTVSGSPYAYITNSFSQPGWVTVTMTATDTSGASSGRANNVGTRTFNNAIFVADSVGVPAEGFYEEFDPSGDLAKWPIFNYYNNEFKWYSCSTAGYYDNYCMAYNGFDSRLNPPMNIYPPTGTPSGDIDDFFTIPFDLTGFDSSSKCNLNFYYSGASRSSNGINVNDSMEIQYSIDSTKTWNTLYTMKKNILENKGSLSYAYTPLYQGDWAPMSINIPSDSRKLRSSYVLFRFRYHPGVGTDGNSSGNNFYIDRINISRFPASVSNVKSDNADVVVAPNPTSGNAFVIINSKDALSANIVVMDITGKVVYRTTEQMTGAEARVEIPQSAISVKGVYLVQTLTGSSVNTQKLIVY